MAETFNTDLLGVFTGEVERVGDPASTARIKRKMAMEWQGCYLSVAPEEFYGLHSMTRFVAAHEEVLICRLRRTAWR